MRCGRLGESRGACGRCDGTSTVSEKSATPTMSIQPPDRLALAARRFAAKNGIRLTCADARDVIRAVDLEMTKRGPGVVRRRWLRIVRFHQRVYGASAPPTASGKTSTALRFLAEYGLRPDDAVTPANAQHLLHMWDKTAKRVFRRPSDAVWLREWWVDRRKRFRVTLAFRADGSAVAGYSDCDGKCVNTPPHSPTSGTMPQKIKPPVSCGPNVPSDGGPTTYGNDTTCVVQNVHDSTSDVARHNDLDGISQGRAPPGMVPASPPDLWL